MATNRPQFWLQIRKDYIFDNFDSLLGYMRQYNYTPGDTHPDFDSTLECMLRFCDDFAERISSTPFYACPDFSDNPATNYDFDSIIRLFAATILASNKAGRTPHRTITALIDLIMKSGMEVEVEYYRMFFSIVMSCVRGLDMLRCGFNWDDIADPTIQPGLFVVKFCRMTFRSAPPGLPTRFLENHGVLAIPPEGVMEIGVCTRQGHAELQGAEQFMLAGLLKVIVAHDEYEKPGDFDRVYHVTNRLLASQDELEGTIVQTVQHEYQPGDQLVVRIISIRGFRIEAESIDPDYAPIQGKVWLQLPDKRPTMNAFGQILQEGEYIPVRISDNPEYAFEIGPIFEAFYRNHASDYAGQRVRAIYTGDYSKGSEWVTSEGVRVGVDNGKLDALSPEDRKRRTGAILSGRPIELRLYSRPPRKDGEYFNVYAEYATDFRVFPESESFTQMDADAFLISAYRQAAIESGQRTETRSPLVSSGDADPTQCLAFLSILSRRIDAGLASCRLRLWYITIVAMLAKMLGREVEQAYMEHRRRALFAQVMFAQDREMPELTHDPILEGAEGIAVRENIINTLRGYRHKQGFGRTLPDDREESQSVHDKVAALVSASNNLVDIIDIIELNNIKQVIARTLGIADEYVSILDDRTFYGMESIKLEFKTSVVFPPANRRRFATAVADPDLQKWMIIKAVCGFLNSRAGGELLIGVSDDGYAVGLNDDIRELYEGGFINAPTIDQYRTYLQHMLDYAFKESSGRASDTDIARTCISYDPEENEEGKTVMRIQIRPFPKSIVSLAAPAKERPQGIDDCFVRLSGRTVAVTPELRTAILQYKQTPEPEDSLA